MIKKLEVTKEFTQVPNGLWTDNRLSGQEIKIIGYLCSLPEEWKINRLDIMQKLNIKNEHSIAKYFKNLIKYGWLKRQQISKNKFQGYSYQILNPLTVNITQMAHIKNKVKIEDDLMDIFRISHNRTLSEVKKQKGA